MDNAQRHKNVAEIRRLESLAAWWAEQAEHIERDRLQLRWFYWAGVPAAGLTAYLWDWRAGAGLLALAALAWVQGMYLCQVHRWEYAYNLGETRRDLWQSRKALLQLQRPTPAGGSYGVSRLPPHPLAQTASEMGRAKK